MRFRSNCNLKLNWTCIGDHSIPPPTTTSTWASSHLLRLWGWNNVFNKISREFLTNLGGALSDNRLWPHLQLSRVRANTWWMKNWNHMDLAATTTTKNCENQNTFKEMVFLAVSSILVTHLILEQKISINQNWHCSIYNLILIMIQHLRHPPPKASQPPDDSSALLHPGDLTLCWYFDWEQELIGIFVVRKALLVTMRAIRGILILQKFEILNFACCKIAPICSLISELFFLL